MAVEWAKRIRYRYLLYQTECGGRTACTVNDCSCDCEWKPRAGLLNAHIEILEAICAFDIAAVSFDRRLCLYCAATRYAASAFRGLIYL